MDVRCVGFPSCESKTCIHRKRHDILWACRGSCKHAMYDKNRAACVPCGVLVVKDEEEP